MKLNTAVNYQHQPRRSATMQITLIPFWSKDPIVENLLDEF